MNGAAGTSRARRGRVLIVGETPELDAALSRIRLASGRPTRVRNLFEALGEITTAPARSPIATVILCEHSMPAMAERAIEAMHKIDPSLRVVMITGGHQPPSPAASRDWLALGVDECVSAPVAAHDVPLLFEDDLIAGDVPLDVQDEDSQTPPAVSAPAMAEPPGSAARTESRVSTPQPSAIHEISDPVPATPVQPVAAPSAPVAPPPSSSASSAAAADVTAAPLLGDTDLVEAILSGANQLPDLALQLIAQQTGWRDIALIDEANACSAPVEFDAQRFGHLISEQARLEQLQPWADWLARWLALHRAHCACRMQAMQDDLTGAGNRRYFEEFLSESIKSAARLRRPVTLMIFDIDNFKLYNDQFGHEAGDEILRETVRLMQTVIRQGDRVCRIGGDEFAVIFAGEEAPREPGSRHPESVEALAKRFQDQICQMRFPKLGPEAPGTLTISAGLATYPWDGGDPAALLRHADQLALESKRKGKNLITFGKGAMRACRPEA